MNELREALASAGAEVSSLALLFDNGQEPVYHLVVSGAQAVAVWRQLRTLLPQTGCWPVLLGDDDCTKQMQKAAKQEASFKTKTILEEARTINPVAWFNNRYLEELKEVERCVEEADKPEVRAYWQGLLASEGPLRGLPQGPWPEDVRPQSTFWIPYQSGEEPLPRVHIALVPTWHGWQVPAFLRYGAWNDCPSPGEHVALFKYWDEWNGAELLGIAGDVVEMRIARPPRTRDAALELAKQQFLYCQDIVIQGAQTLQRLAAELLDDATWFFWWD
jgi:hypothetical protein